MIALRTASALNHSARSRGAQQIRRRLSEQSRPRELTLADRIEIETLVTEYAWLVDHDRMDEIAALCTQDAELNVARTTSRGTTQHQMTNLRLQATGPGRATGVAVVVVHVAKQGRRGTYVDLVGEFHDEYVRTSIGWRFSSRRLVHLADR